MTTLGTLVCLSGLLQSDNGKEEEVKRLIEELKDPKDPVRKKAANALGELGEQAKEAVPLLVDVALKDSNAFVRVSAALALGKLGEHAKEAVPLLVAAALNDPDDSVRASAGYALGELGEQAKEVLPQLIDMALNNPDASMRAKAAATLARLGEHAKEALPLLIDAALKNSDASVRETALSALESLRGFFLKDFDRLLKERGDFHFPPAEANPCKVLCGLVDKSNSWISEYDAKPELLSLSALFLSKASPFCPKAKGITQHIIAYLSTTEPKPESSDSCPPDTFPFEELQTFATDVLAMTASPLDSPQVHGKQFLTLFLRDVLRREKDPQLITAVTTLLEKTENSLAQDLIQKSPASTTFSLSTALLTLRQENAKEIKILEQAIKPDDPLRIKDTGDNPSFDSERGSAARAVPAHLARYIKLPQKDRDRARKNLISAIQNYVRHLPSLMAHSRRGGSSRMGLDELAPSDLYTTLPYQTAAIELLLEELPEKKEKTLREQMKEEAQMKMLEQMREETQGAIFNLVREDGQFYVPEHESSPGYVPLLGLALIPLAKDCKTTTLDK